MLRQAPSAVAGLATALTLATAHAQPPADAAAAGIACGERVALVAALTDRYKEKPVSMGLQNNGKLLEIYASALSGSWTILSTAVDGTSCILAVGKHYEQRRLDPNDATAANGGRDREPDTAS